MKDFFIARRLGAAVLCGLVFAVSLSFAGFEAACGDLRSNVLRLHIIANSDSEEDQRVKLMVRDCILRKSPELFSSCTRLSDAERAAGEALCGLEDAAQAVLEQNGFEYGATAEIGDSYFENRDYDGFTLPAGTYRSLIIRLGSAKGKNWWCVIFPAVCVPAAGGRLSDSVSDRGTQVAESPERYIVRFKAVEIYEDIKKLLKK